MTRVASLAAIIVTLMAGHAAGRVTGTPLEQVADVIVVITPRERYSLHRPATVDRIIMGDIVRTEKGGPPILIIHTKNTFTAPLEAGVPVRLYLKAFPDGHRHYIIGVSTGISTQPLESQP